MTTPDKDTEALDQPLSQHVPDRIWLLDLGSGDIAWCNEPDPDGEQVCAVEYVRPAALRTPSTPHVGEDVREAAAKIAEGCPWPDHGYQIAANIRSMPLPKSAGVGDDVLREAREDMAMCVAEMAKARGRLETIAGCNEDRRIAASLGSTCDHLRSRWFNEETRIDALLSTDTVPTPPQCTDLADDEAKAERCPDCAGDGWVVGIGVECREGCCGGSDWECGGPGCTGPIPIQEQVQIQECCERCHGMGSIEQGQHLPPSEGGRE